MDSDDATQAVRIFSIQHFCLHDGPGTRSLVFFKGCPLRCAWCCNPESWTRKPQLAHKSHRCIGCLSCVQACPTGAMRGPNDWTEEDCDNCGRCVEACPSGALVQFGDAMPIEQVMEALRPEYGLYARSGGGVTFSGGEATLAGAYATSLAQALRADGVHVAIETCGLFNLGAQGRPSEAAVLLENVDLVLFDLKLFDDEKHMEHCGASNRPIVRNLRELVARRTRGWGPALWPRMPMVPGVTATDANLRGWAGLLRELAISQVTLLPYHALGSGKRRWLHGVPSAPDLGALDEETLQRCHEQLAQEGIEAFAPGEEPWGRIEAHVRPRASGS